MQPTPRFRGMERRRALGHRRARERSEREGPCEKNLRAARDAMIPGSTPREDRKVPTILPRQPIHEVQADSGCLGEELVCRVLEGMLPEEERRFVERHLDSCASCRQLVG